MTHEEKCSQEAEDYADVVASSGAGITYDDAYNHYMKKYLSDFKKEERKDGETD